MSSSISVEFYKPNSEEGIRDNELTRFRKRYNNR